MVVHVCSILLSQFVQHSIPPTSTSMPVMGWQGIRKVPYWRRHGSSENWGQGSCDGRQRNELEAKCVRELVANRNGEWGVRVTNGDLDWLNHHESTWGTCSWTFGLHQVLYRKRLVQVLCDMKSQVLWEFKVKNHFIQLWKLSWKSSLWFQSWMINRTWTSNNSDGPGRGRGDIRSYSRNEADTQEKGL